MMLLKATIIFLVFLSINIAHAELKKTDSSALEQTQTLLRNGAARDKVIRESPGSKKYVDQMNQMGMNRSQKDSTFDISADIFSQLVKDNNGDAEAVKNMLLKASQNPEAFYNSLTPESRQMIQNLGSGIESNTSKSPD